jgi:hypothetical protein
MCNVFYPTTRQDADADIFMLLEPMGIPDALEPPGTKPVVFEDDDPEMTAPAATPMEVACHG